MEESRTSNTLKNMRTGAIVQIINKLMAFIVRTIFIQTLNSEYLGLNGLFTNILSILSFTELGIGTAIGFSMYKPIANDDKEKIKSLMKLYKISYTVVGCIIFSVGICIIPFFGMIIKEIPNIKENIICIYLLFLFNTSSSYFFAYKKSIITAYQKQRIINNADSICYLAKSILEIVILVTLKNYILYLITEIFTTFIENIVLSIKANKMFPFIKDKKVKKLPSQEKKNIFSNIKSLIIYKLGDTLLFSTDNILISSMIDVNTVGIYSNYSLIIEAIKGIIKNIVDGATASVGNLNASNNIEKEKSIFFQLTLINFLIYSFCAIVFIILLNPFISFWIGNDYLLSISSLIVLAINFFIEGIRHTSLVYRSTLGLFAKVKTAPYIAAIVNIVSSILLCKKFGIIGIFIGTTLAQLCSYVWMDPYMIFKYEFKTPFLEYLRKLFIYIIVFIVEIIVSLWITSFISNGGFLNFILKAIIAIIIPNTFNIIVFHKTKEFQALKERVMYLFHNKKFKIQ